MRGLFCAVNRAVTAMTVLILLLAAVLVLPRAAGIVPYVVRSGSMEPAIPTGAVAFVNTRDRNARPGDIITYRLENGQGRELFVTHRVLELVDGRYVTKGDANDGRDQYLVEEGQLVGTYLFQLPRLGYLLSGLDKRRLTAASLWIFLANGMALWLNSALGEESAGEKEALEAKEKRAGSRPQTAVCKNKKEKGVRDEL